MPRGKKHGPEEVIPKLREAEVLISQGSTQEFAAKQIGVTKQTLIRWRKEYGGFRMDQAKRMKQLEKENAKLKKLLAEAELDKAILKEAASGNF
jgi:putative transposase